MPVKTFRGLMADGAIDIINLHTNTGSTGYQIKRLEVITESPADTAPEAILKIYSVKQTAVTAKIDFSDQTLIAAAFYNQDATAANIVSRVIVFDNTITNQDIYLTYIDDNTGSATSLNYYMELEQVSLDLNENTVATLKNIRNVTSP
jgi:hypothetical protein